MSLAFRRSGARLSASWMASIPQVYSVSSNFLSLIQEVGAYCPRVPCLIELVLGMMCMVVTLHGSGAHPTSHIICTMIMIVGTARRFIWADRRVQQGPGPEENQPGYRRLP